MKILLFLLFTLFLNADYLNTLDNSCISNVYPDNNSTGLCFTKSLDNIQYCDSSLNYNLLINGFYLLNNSCVLQNDLLLTGLTFEDFNFHLALIANLLGFTMFFLISFLAVLISRK